MLVNHSPKEQGIGLKDYTGYQVLLIKLGRYVSLLNQILLNSNLGKSSVL